LKASGEIEFAGVKRFGGFVNTRALLIFCTSAATRSRVFHLRGLADDIEAGQQIDPQRYVPERWPRKWNCGSACPRGMRARGVALIAALASCIGAVGASRRETGEHRVCSRRAEAGDVG
jgi:hypothetical protein